MFDDPVGELKKLEAGKSISVPIQIDDSGYLDRLCPWSECSFDFKVLLEDWKAKVPDESVYCLF